MRITWRFSGEYIRLTRDKEFHVIVGRDSLTHAGLCSGGTGAIAACANVAPRIVAYIYDTYEAGDIKGSLGAQFRWHRFASPSAWEHSRR